MVAGGLRSISLVQPSMKRSHVKEDWLAEHQPDRWMPEIGPSAPHLLPRH
jgi:hypothetical protein